MPDFTIASHEIIDTYSASPAYDEVDRLDQTSNHADPELPAYVLGSDRARGHGQVVHEYILTNNSGYPWMKMVVRSKARDPTHTPFFMEGQVIAGSVSLDLPKPDNLKSVSITVR